MLACEARARGGAVDGGAGLGGGVTAGWTPRGRMLFAASTKTCQRQRRPPSVAAVVYGSRRVVCLCRFLLVTLVGGLRGRVDG